MSKGSGWVSLGPVPLSTCDENNLIDLVVCFQSQIDFQLNAWVCFMRAHPKRKMFNHVRVEPNRTKKPRNYRNSFNEIRFGVTITFPIGQSFSGWNDRSVLSTEIRCSQLCSFGGYSLHCVDASFALSFQSTFDQRVN